MEPTQLPGFEHVSSSPAPSSGADPDNVRVPARLPLNVLVSQTLLGLTEEFVRLGAGTPPLPSLTMWSNVLQHVDDDGVDLRRLPEISRLTKRVIGPAVKTLETSGYVVVEAKIVRLTILGRRAHQAWPVCSMLSTHTGAISSATTSSTHSARVWWTWSAGSSSSCRITP